MINSDKDYKLTMHASQSFDHILEQIQSSCLNYQIQISPFSAIISLKKSMGKDRSGNPFFPSNQLDKKPLATKEQVEALVAKNYELERKLNCLRNEHEAVVDDCTEAHQKVRILEKLQGVKVKNEEATISNSRHLENEISELKEALKDRDCEIKDLQLVNKADKETFRKLNMTLRDIE